MVAVTRNKEERKKSSEDMNKGAGEMDEGSGVRQERQRWMESGCTGAQLRRETIHRCTKEIWERLWKNDKSRSWGRRDNEQRQRERSVCLCERETPRPTGRRGEKKRNLSDRIGRGEKEMHSERCKNNEIQEMFVTDRGGKNDSRRVHPRKKSDQLSTFFFIYPI